jgi:hypothetical protein
MWMPYIFIAYLVLAFAIPVAIAVTPVWLGARRPRQVRCPVGGQLARIELDPWFAVRTHAVKGAPELCVRACSHWPERADCGRECLPQVEARP